MSITFTKLRYRNFLATGDAFTEIDLNASSTTLITGANGRGKSTLLDALTFALYNKPFRKITKPQIVNSINNKQTVTEVEFQSGSKFYLVRRGIKPNIFEMYEGLAGQELGAEDTLMPQDAKTGDYQVTLERDILKMNYQAFTQIVILGKATYVPFMRLGAADRRQVIEDLLGLRIFGTMNKLLKDKVKSLKANLQACEQNVDMCTDRIKQRQRYIDSMAQDRSEQIVEAEAKTEELIASVDKCDGNIAKLTHARELLVVETAEESALNSKRMKLVQMKTKLNAKTEEHGDVVEFFTNHDECPTCTQAINDDTRAPIIADRQAKMDQLEAGQEKIKSEMGEIDIFMDVINAANVKIGKIDGKVSDLSATMRQQNRQIKELHQTVSKLNNVDTSKDQTEVDELTEDLKDLHDHQQQLQETSLYYQNIALMLKDDGIKTLIINKYLPVFNNLINVYLQKMGFVCKFTLDEQFNEQILSRYRDKFSYNNFSEGQKLRIDLAILLTWREVAKMKNSLNCNLLIMDEVFDSSLDQSGVDAFMDLLPQMGDSNIFVVSHTPEKLHDKFASHINFVMDDGFSVIDNQTT